MLTCAGTSATWGAVGEPEDGQSALGWEKATGLCSTLKEYVLFKAFKNMTNLYLWLLDNGYGSK